MRIRRIDFENFRGSKTQVASRSASGLPGRSPVSRMVAPTVDRTALRPPH